ncbi:general secretion pathway protein D, partial [mine drainage metagenome]
SAPIWIAADERNNSILVRGSPQERLEIKTLIDRLDTPVRHGGNTQVIHLHYARAASLAKILESYVKAAQAERPVAKGQSPHNFRAVVAADKGTNSLIVTAPPRLMRSIRSIIHKLDIRRAQVLVQAIIAELSSNTAAQLGVTWVTDALQTAGTAALTNFSGTGTGVVQLGEAYLAGQTGLSSTGTSTGVTGASSSLSSVRMVFC